MNWKLVFGVASIAIGVQIYWYYLTFGIYTTVDPNQAHCFSSSYHEARLKFRQQLRQKSIQLVTLPLPMEDMDLTIDIGILHRSPTKVLLHISGTHGVEGFAGSAIQLALLDQLETRHDQTQPTIVFIHALNPYGFAFLRRFNENNVDLNRNFLTTEQFARNRQRDPNAFGYLTFYEMINPTASVDYWSDLFYLRALYYIVHHGFYTLKETIVTGNYHYPQSLFYGGQELQSSHEILKHFLETQLDFSSISDIGIIDVHTGLGPNGFDTLICKSGMPATIAHQVFGGPNGEFEHHISTFDDHTNHVMAGYARAMGSVPEGIVNQLVRNHTKNVYGITQEFGTVPGLFVFKALRAENAMYHYDNAHRLPYAEALRNVFYLHQNAQWKKTILDRGVQVFHQLYTALLQST